jgi:HlyD family secretion protein
VANDDLSLRPGMTGNAEITTLTRENVLLVPNAALRFTPQTTATVQKKSGGSVLGALFPRRPAPVKKVRIENETGSARVWVLRGAEAVPVDVQTGASNGRVTEVTGGDLAAGTPVIIETVSSRG